MNRKLKLAKMILSVPNSQIPDDLDPDEGIVYPEYLNYREPNESYNDFIKRIRYKKYHIPLREFEDYFIHHKPLTKVQLEHLDYCLECQEHYKVWESETKNPSNEEN